MIHSEEFPMAVDPRRVKALFNTARDLLAPTERSTYLDRECGEDTELRQRLEELLAATDPPGGELDRSDAEFVAAADHTDESAARVEPAVSPMELTVSLVSDEVPTTSLIGSVIAGRYKIREEIGEGGMGSVYLAEQARPIWRMVALKLIKPGMDWRAKLNANSASRSEDDKKGARMIPAASAPVGIESPKILRK
jgi:eukaryotic-like serine/threonine-protein kinase